MDGSIANEVLRHSASAPTDHAESGALRAPAIPAYRLIKSLGHGGQGQVFQAIRLSDQQKVAIKLILPGRLADLRSRARFEQEWRTLEQLVHPNIVRVLDHGSLDSGELWFAAEYIDGVPVNQFVHDLDRVALTHGDSSGRYRFPLEKVLDLFVRICRGVEAAHQAGILHRDLKPANILVDDNGQPHLLDFGLARTEQRESPDAVTLTGQFMGSPIWCSPEQIAARPSLIDVRTDVYSIGMMLYHALTGDFPFDTEQPWPQLFEAIRTAEPKPLRAIRSFIDADLETLVLTAIAKDKQRRYASIAALREDIERYLAGLPIGARADSRLYRISKFARRNRILVASLAVVMLLTSGYAISVTMLYRRAEDHAADAREKYRHVRNMYDFILSQVDTRLAKLPGAAETRRNILEKAFAQLDILVKGKTDDPALQDDIAKTHARLADISQSLGRIDRATEEVTAALEIRRRLADESPHDAIALADLSIALVRVGDIECARGDRQRGREFYEQALTIDQGLVTAHPENLQWLDQLSWSFDRLCWAAIFEGDMPLAADFHKKRLKMARQLLGMEPESPTRKRNLLAALLQTTPQSTLGEASVGLSLKERADEAQSLVKDLLAGEPDNPDYLAQLFTLCTLRADIAKQERHCSDWQSALQEGLVTVEHVLEAEPEDRDWCWRRVVLLRELGSSAQNLSQYPEALDWYQQAVDGASALAARLPADTGIQQVHADAIGALAGLHWREGRIEDARQRYGEAIRLYKTCSEEARPEPAHLCMAAELLATCPVEELREPELALRLARRGVELSRQRSPTLLLSLAICQKAVGQIGESRQTHAEALSLLRPGPSQSRNQLQDFASTLPAP